MSKLNLKIFAVRCALFAGVYMSAALVPDPLIRIFAVMPFALGLWFLAYYEGCIAGAEL